MNELVSSNYNAGNVVVPAEHQITTDGFQAYQFDELPLAALKNQPEQSLTLHNVYFQTADGNSYVLLKSPTDSSDTDKFILIDKNKNIADRNPSEAFFSKEIAEDEVDTLTLARGQKFRFSTGNTAEVTKITAINKDKKYTPEEIKQMPPANVTDVRQEFLNGLENKTPPSNPESKSISNDDEKIIKHFLYPETGNLTYMLFTGMSSVNQTELSPDKRLLTPEKRKLAQEGMRDLFDAEFEPIISFGKPGIEGARAGLERIQRGENVKTRDALMKYGRKLEYQSFAHNMSVLQESGDFLHFGKNYAQPNAPDKLPHQVRVYVTPKVEYSGQIAARVIRKSREKGYEPYGKVFDQSTAEDNHISTRTDRLLFAVRTESQLKIVMDALKDVQQSNPDMFEDDPPLLAEKTDVRGVGLAEEPTKINGEKRSFNQSREELIVKAWHTTLEALAGEEKEHIHLSNASIDKRIIDIRQALETGKLPMSKVLNEYRKQVKNLSPMHGVSPDNFAQNL